MQKKLLFRTENNFDGNSFLSVHKIHVSKIINETNGFEILIENATEPIPTEEPTEVLTEEPADVQTEVSTELSTEVPTEVMTIEPEVPTTPPALPVLYVSKLSRSSSVPTKKSPCPCVSARRFISSSTKTTTTRPTTSQPPTTLTSTSTTTTTPCPCHRHKKASKKPSVASTTGTTLTIKTSSVYEALSQTTSVGPIEDGDTSIENCTDSTTTLIPTTSVS